MPITLLLTRKDRKNSDDIYDRLQAVKKKGDDYILECSLSEQLDESRNKYNLHVVFTPLKFPHPKHAQIRIADHTHF